LTNLLILIYNRIKIIYGIIYKERLALGGGEESAKTG